MAIIYSLVVPVWTPVLARTRTLIARGPLVQGVPLQYVTFGHFAPDAPITFTITVYSAAAPWYNVQPGNGTVYNRIFADGSIGLPFFQTGFPLVMLASPWVEVYVVTNRNCATWFVGI